MYLSLLQEQNVTDMTPLALGQKLEKIAVLTCVPNHYDDGASMHCHNKVHLSITMDEKTADQS